MSTSFLSAASARSADADVQPSTPMNGNSEPSRERAIELELIGHMLEAKLLHGGTCAHGFGRVWRDHVVPVAAGPTTVWQLGMCAEITGLTFGAEKFNGVIGRIASHMPGSGSYELVFESPEGLVHAEITPTNLKATVNIKGILQVWRHIIPNVPAHNPYSAVKDARAHLLKADTAGPLPVTVLSGFLGAGKVRPSHISTSIVLTFAHYLSGY